MTTRTRAKKTASAVTAAPATDEAATAMEAAMQSMSCIVISIVSNLIPCGGGASLARAVWTASVMKRAVRFGARSWTFPTESGLGVRVVGGMGGKLAGRLLEELHDEFPELHELRLEFLLCHEIIVLRVLRLR